MFNTPYYNPQANIDRINNQIAELEKMKAQIPTGPLPTQQPAINQTFQLAPSGASGIKYVNSIDDVNKEIVIADTPFFSKDFTVMWLKNTKGEVKAYSLAEIVQKDEKDLMIENLQYQIEELRKEMRENAKPSYDNVSKPIESEKPTDVQPVRAVKKK